MSTVAQTDSIHKTKINEQIVAAFLAQELHGEVSNLKYIHGGESSQAFSFEVNGQELVIRINDRNPDGFQKDEYAFKHFSSVSIPVPEVIKIGHINGYYYCTSKKASGRTVGDFSEVERLKILPAILSVADKIHEISVSDKAGYGKWNNDGIGIKNSWKESILCVDEYVWGTDNNPNYFATTFLDQNLWERAYNKMEELLKYCPEDRYLVHGDLGFDNVMSDGTKVTAVIDWADSRYGDFLFDIAWLSFWRIDNSYEEVCLAHYKNKTIANLKERLQCYQIFIALNSLSFYAYSMQEEKTKFPTAKLLRLLEL